MPELHRLTPPLGVLQDQGFKVALVTDGRMSGASGKVPAVIHLSPEALLDGPLGKVRTGDMLVIDAEAGVLDVEIDAHEWARREVAKPAHQIRTKSASAANCSACFAPRPRRRIRRIGVRADARRTHRRRGRDTERGSGALMARRGNER